MLRTFNWIGLFGFYAHFARNGCKEWKTKSVNCYWIQAISKMSGLPIFVHYLFKAVSQNTTHNRYTP